MNGTALEAVAFTHHSLLSKVLPEASLVYVLGHVLHYQASVRRLHRGDLASSPPSLIPSPPPFQINAGVGTPVVSVGVRERGSPLLQAEVPFFTTYSINCLQAVWPTRDFLLCRSSSLVAVGSGSLVGTASGYLYA